MRKEKRRRGRQKEALGNGTWATEGDLGKRLSLIKESIVEEEALKRQRLGSDFAVKVFLKGVDIEERLARSIVRINHLEESFGDMWKLTGGVVQDVGEKWRSHGSKHVTLTPRSTR